MKTFIAGLALLASMSGASATTAFYHCTDGTSVRAVFSAPGMAGTAKLRFNRKQASVTLPQALAADGGRYSNGTLEFWIKGNTAKLTRDGATTACVTK